MIRGIVFVSSSIKSLSHHFMRRSTFFPVFLHYFTPVALSLLVSTGLQAQNELMLRDTILDAQYFKEQGDWFKVKQWGLSLSTMRDEALSPLLYGGLGFFWTSHTYKFKPKVMVHPQWGINSMSFTNAQSESLLSQTTFEYVHARHQPIALANENVKLYVGGYASGLFNLKLHPENVNNVLSYELVASVGPSGMVQFPLTLFGKHLVLSDELRFPLLSLLGNTPYAWPLPTTFDEEGPLGDAFAVGSWGRLFRLTNAVNVDFHRRVRRRKKTVKRVAYRLSYRWEFVSVAQPNLISVRHAFFVSCPHHRIIKNWY